MAPPFHFFYLLAKKSLSIYTTHVDKSLGIIQGSGHLRQWDILQHFQQGLRRVNWLA